MSEVDSKPWRAHRLYPFQKVTFRNGQPCTDTVVMRRKAIAGHWEYRPMTWDEREEDDQSLAW